MIHIKQVLLSGIRRPYLQLIAIVLLWSPAFAAPESLYHDLRITLLPAENRLSGVDRLTVNPEQASSLSFRLSERAIVHEVAVKGKPAPFEFRKGQLRVLLESQERSGGVPVTIRYEGVFDDPIPLSPINTDNTGYGVTGSISEKGCFLQAGAGWYPEIPRSMPGYRLEVVAPKGVLAISAGKLLGHRTKGARTFSTWEVKHPVQGLSLSAYRYLVREKMVGEIRAMTYLFPGSEHLAQRYLDATARYISFYEELFGPYPFDKFAVVENFFPTGYGFPSYTLLGSTVIRLPFIVHTSLGHEIAHCWWGNGVYADYGTGNWSEPLATYVADYLHEERTSEEEARQYRQQVLRNYASLVRPQDDFPLSHFKSRYNPSSQAIGYGKGAMVFHMIRHRIGEKAFWDALRDLYRERLFKKASWKDFMAAFERRAGVSLQRFFEQWISRKGAPQLSLEGVRSTGMDGVWRVSGEILQKGPPYELDLTLELNTETEKLRERVGVSGEATTFEITCDSTPETLTVDPAYHTFRQLYASEIPPSVNSIKGSGSVLVILADSPQDGMEDAAETLSLSLGLKKFKIVPEDRVQNGAMLRNDVLLLGLPERRVLPLEPKSNLSIGEGGFSLNGRIYNHPSDAFFGVFAHPKVAGRFMALFLPLSTAYAGEVARKVTHYGKYSYLAFKEGRNQDRGIWPAIESPLVHRWGGKIGDN